MRTLRLPPRHGRLGLVLVLLGEALIAAHTRPASDFYFPVVWSGYLLVLDAAIRRQTGWSPLEDRPGILFLFPLSAAFWWVFELFNGAVHNWIYVGAESYRGLAYATVASLDFSFVLPAVWMSALLLSTLLSLGRPLSRARIGDGVLAAVFALGIVCLLLPIVFPHYFFGLIWICLFFLLDPINYRAGRPSLLEALARGDWRTPLCFALGALMCGFFWESWNFWATPKWIYAIPYVNFLHVFEMPLLGWTGYLPFGLELYAMANFVLPRIGLEGLDVIRAPAGRAWRFPVGAASGQPALSDTRTPG